MAVYRCVFGLAAVCNLALGLWAGLFPRDFLPLFGLDTPRSPSIWAGLGLWVGVYALAYAYVAWKPERGNPLAALGLLGQVLGSLIWIGAIAAGELPPQTFPLILVADLIWWFPFLYYLLRKLPLRRTIIAWVGVAAHIAACLALLAAAGGTEVVPEMAARRQWVAEHVPLWVATWMLWALASMSLMAFTLAWTLHLLERGAPRGLVLAGGLLVGLGLLFDLTGESLNLMWPTRPGFTEADFAWAARLYAILSAGTANGLYCVGGLVLSGVSWRIGWQRGAVGVLGFALWLIGLALTGAVIGDSGPGMIVTGGGVMALYIPWAAIVGWRLSARGKAAP
jgi:hypothetical protein